MKRLRLIGFLAVMIGLVVACDPGPSSVEWVDLGCSVLWADHNVGATLPEEFGDYFAWGETEPKESYDIDNSLTHKKSGTWDEDKIRGFAGNAQYDAATANWGETCRMPTWADFEELQARCTRKWVTKNGVKGYLFQGRGRYSDNSIFIPAAGYRKETSFSGGNRRGRYGCATPLENHTVYTLIYEFEYEGGGVTWNNRYHGISVRPVREKKR